MNVKEKGFNVLFLLTALISIIAVVFICGFLFANGLPAMSKIGFADFLFGMDWKPSSDIFGIFPMIIGSLYITAIAILLGVPIGVMSAVFLTHFCPKKVYSLLKPAVDLLAGIPSIIYGFFGMTVLVPFVRDYFGGNGNSILAASILLAIMILPTIITISETSLRAVPSALYENARALGSTHERSVVCVVVPAAKSGIVASIVLGIGRVIGETMAVIMIAGNQARVTGDILKGIRTLTANVVIEMKYASGLHEEALVATGVVLFVFILLINVSFSLLKNKAGKK